MELKVGMYVRFDYHRVTVPIQIAKIKEKYYDKMEKYYYYLTDNGLIVSEENIIKASENIIGLIEVGDYVNGVEVEEINDKEIMLVDTHLWIDKEVANRLIESIVTKELFDSVKYEVE